MSRKESVIEFLSSIESETGKRFGYAAAPLATGVGNILINIYPVDAEASERTFNLHDGLTLAMRQEIRAWTEHLLSSTPIL